MTFHTVTSDSIRLRMGRFLWGRESWVGTGGTGHPTSAGTHVYRLPPRTTATRVQSPSSESGLVGRGRTNTNPEDQRPEER